MRFDCKSILAVSSALTAGEHLKFSLVIKNVYAVCTYINLQANHRTSEVTRDLFSWIFRKSSIKSAKRRRRMASQVQDHVEFSFEPY